MQEEEKQGVYWYEYDGKNDYERVPLVIRLANIFIHQMYDVDKSKSRNHDVLNILSKISKLSQEMKRYFLDNFMVGRLLEWFYREKLNKPAVFSDLSTIPLYKTDIKCFISQYEHDSLLQDLDSTATVNENRESRCFTIQYETFFYELLSDLVCSWRFRDQDPYPTQEVITHKTEQSKVESLDDIKTQPNEEYKGELLTDTEESKVSTEEQIMASQDEQTMASQDEEAKEWNIEKVELKEIMSPFYNGEEEPFLLSEIEEEYLYSPSDEMLIKLFKTSNNYIATSRFLGKMYAHLWWANEQFSSTYISKLGHFIKDADFEEIRKKFRIPLIQCLLLNDNGTTMHNRAKVAMKRLFSQHFMAIKDKYYILAFEVLHLIFDIAKKTKSIAVLFKVHKDLLQKEIYEFLDKDPEIWLNLIQWTPSIPRSAVTLDVNRKLMDSSVADTIKLDILTMKKKLEEIFNGIYEDTYIDIHQTMESKQYLPKDELQFYSEKYKNWVNAEVIQTLSSEVIFIKCQISKKEKNSPIFVFKEVLESLDLDSNGESYQEVETSAYFLRLIKLLADESI